MAKYLTALTITFALAAMSVMAQPTDKVVAANYAPLMIEGDTDNPGYAVEVLREAAKRSGRNIELTFLPFQRAMQSIQTDPATLMPALFFGKKHNDQFQWVVEIQRAKIRFATLSGDINSLEDARAAASIVVETGTTADVFLTNLGFENLVHVIGVRSSARMLESGRVDAWFQDDSAMSKVWSRLKLSQPLMFSAFIHEVPIFMVASPGLPPDVAQAYKEAVQTMREDGTLDRIWTRYTQD